MKKGEKAIFTIPLELGYEESGSPPLIPPNATLQFEVEMLSWATVRYVCKYGGLLKKSVRDGERWAYPKNADEVLVPIYLGSFFMEIQRTLTIGCYFQRLLLFLLNALIP